ncbi:sigma-54 dependent transcriptional regulator [Treponema sp.]
MLETDDTKKLRVLIIDDEKNLRESLGQYLEGEGLEARLAASGEEARSILENKSFDAVVVDLRMPQMSGLEFLTWLKDSGPLIPAIMISAHGELADAVQAMKLGASDYLVKPFDPEELVLRLRRVVEDSRLRGTLQALERSQTRQSRISDEADAWVGSGKIMQELRHLINRVAPTKSTVLITGESGTGKEVVARLIHKISSRNAGPFIPINLGGLPENLLESELFGYEKGAFTGAESRKTGLFELANGGTLFLDETGDMPLTLQVKLLRVLQDKKIMRLGATRQIPIDVRIIAATNKDLEEAVHSGKFREDLFYRLAVIRLHIPPLRERREDITVLAELFAQRYALEMGKSALRLDPSTLALLESYAFPGNVRELENAMERAVILCDNEVLKAEDFSFAGARMGEKTASPRPHQSPKSILSERAPIETQGELKELEKQAILAALERNKGHREKTAAELGITRRTLLNKMKEYELKLLF